MDASKLCERWCLSLFSAALGIKRVQKLQELAHEHLENIFKLNPESQQLEQCPNNGKVTFTRQGDHVVQGFGHEGKLVGNVLETGNEGRKFYFCKQGIRHGFYIEQNHNNLEAIGRYENGSKAGVWWIRLEGDCFMVKNYDTKEHIFIYPDFETVLEGTFDEDFNIISGWESNLIGFKEDFFLLKPVVKANNENLIKHEENTLDICQNPLQEDPYEIKHVEVKPSNISDAGEGLFAKATIPKGRIVTFFNGVKTKEESAASSDYSIALDPELGFMLDIPEESRSTAQYCATLAHKICHSFAPNAAYGHAFHPRFGRIRCAVSLKEIELGQEITCDYRYSWDKAPIWYKEGLIKYLKEEVRLSDDQIRDWIENREKKSSNISNRRK